METKVPDGTFVEDRFNHLKEIAIYNQDVTEHLLRVIDILAESYKLLHTHLAYVIYTQLDSEVTFSREGLNQFVWHITSVENEDDLITTLKVNRTRIPEDESNNSSTGIE